MALASEDAIASCYPLTGSYVETVGVDAVVWLRGEHDASTTKELSGILDDAVDASQADVIVDLSGVDFMAAAPVGVLCRAHAALALLSRSLVLRDPSTSAQLILDLCAVFWQPKVTVSKPFAEPVSRAR